MPEPVVHVVHATSPGCHWSWGFEAAFNRLRMVYGDQVALHLRIGCPYEDKAQWLVDYGMTEKETEDWINDEMPGIMGVPIARVRWNAQPQSILPASLATLAARRQDETKAWRFNRALLRMFAVEGKDPGARPVIDAALAESGLDAERFARDFADEEALRRELEHQGAQGPPVHVGFYNVVVTDGEKRRVILDYCFDPQEIEAAIDYIAGGRLRKRALDPKDIPGYLREHGLAPLSEIGRVFGLAPEDAPGAVEAHEKAGRIERVMLAGAPHWRVSA